MKTYLDLADFKKDIKKNFPDYKIKTKRTSYFISVDITHKDERFPINRQIFLKEDLEKHNAIIQYIKNTRDQFRVANGTIECIF